MFTFQLDNTKGYSLPAPHCRNGSCRYVQAITLTTPKATGHQFLLDLSKHLVKPGLYFMSITIIVDPANLRSKGVTNLLPNEQFQLLDWS